MSNRRKRFSLVSFLIGEVQSVGDDPFFASEIQNWDDDTLEYRHDFIQFAFPLCEPSNFNGFAPIVEVAEILTLRRDQRCVDAVRRSFERMLEFYGFCLPANSGDSSDVNEPASVQQSERFKVRSTKSWAKSRDHNHMRITRILRSLKIFGLEALSHAFYLALLNAIEQHRIPVNQTSLEFWCDADQYNPLADVPCVPSDAGSDDANKEK